MGKRYRRFIFFAVVAGVLIGVLASGILWPSPYYEPADRVTEVVNENGEIELVRTRAPERKKFLFLPMPWFSEVEPVEDFVPVVLTEEEEDDLDKLMQDAVGKLTLSEQLQVVKIAFTRLNSEERGRMLAMLRGDVTMDEALAAYRLLRERLTEDEMVLTLNLMRKYRGELEELLKR